jgi:hypothetical protein
MNTDYLDKTPRLVLYNIDTDSVIVLDRDKIISDWIHDSFYL